MTYRAQRPALEARLGAVASGILSAVVALSWSWSASASPSRWRQIADPQLRAEQALIDETEVQLLAKRSRERKGPSVEDAVLPTSVYAMRARAALSEAGAENATSPFLRMLFGRVEQQLQNYAEARTLFESVLRDPQAPISLVSDVQADLAIVYAHLREVKLEVEAEDQALALEPINISRSLILANQAEGYMGLGNTRRAVAGYRAALEGLGSFEMQIVAPTTLFSLGVALDRSGDLEAGLEQVQRARTYDPLDRRLSGDSWFFSIPHDESWYRGLGHWLVGRMGDGDDVRLDAYERAVLAFRLYVARAPQDDPYLPLARKRLIQVEREFEAHGKKVRTPTPLLLEP